MHVHVSVPFPIFHRPGADKHFHWGINIVTGKPPLTCFCGCMKHVSIHFPRLFFGVALKKASCVFLTASLLLFVLWMIGSA